MKTEKRPKKGLTIDECVKKARKYIKKYGACLLWFDVVGSRRFSDPHWLRHRLETMMKDVNSKFSDYFLETDLAIAGRVEKGFQTLRPGDDSSWAGINNAEIIPEIIEYQKEKYSDIPVYWGVAKDGYAGEDWD